jgi:AraC-like DNA-binding protein
MVPAQIIEMSTTDPDLAHRTLNEVFVPDRPVVYAGTPEKFEFSLTAMRLGTLQAGRFRHTMRTRAEVAPFDDFFAAVLLDGQVDWQLGRDRIGQRPGEVVRYSTTAACTPSWERIEVALISIPLAAVERFAGAHTGAGPGTLRFDGIEPVSVTAARQWRTLTAFVHQSLAATDSMVDNPLIRAELIDVIAATALTVFPNSTMTASIRPGPGALEPAALRRAVAYVEAHAAEPITLGDIADAAGTTGRAVQAAFRRHYGTTPTGYLRRVRLDAVHRELTAADPGTGVTVGALAVRWGFGHAARFASFYREQYGELPSRTLRR